MKRSEFWTEERTGLLRKLYTEDRKSASQIAEIFSDMTRTPISRNMICGKLARLGVFRKTDDPQHGKPRSPKQKRILKPRVSITRVNTNSTAVRVSIVHEPASIARLREADVQSLAVQFLDLTSDICHYPEGDPPLFCGHPITAGSSYCVAHHRLCTKRD